MEPENRSARVLILEDDPRDIRTAANLAIQAGFSGVESLTSSALAMARLGNKIEDGDPLPDVIIIDLNLGSESGFELLRFVHRNHLMLRVPLIVWTEMGEHEREICGLFGVSNFVSKHDGPDALLTVLSRIRTGTHAPPAA